MFADGNLTKTFTDFGYDWDAEGPPTGGTHLMHKTLVHGDLRLDNLFFDWEAPGQIRKNAMGAPIWCGHATSRCRSSGARRVS